MLNNIFDAHCHYDDKWFDEDRTQLLELLPKAGVSGVITNATDLRSAEVIRGYAEKYPYIYFTAGFHPTTISTGLHSF